MWIWTILGENENYIMGLRPAHSTRTSKRSCQFYGWASHSEKPIISFGVLKIGLLIAFWTQGMWIVMVFAFLTQIFYAC